jgi:crossover junction endodeoxyribonuclease RusA
VTFELILPWPPKELSPNARVHWREKAKLTKAYKTACWALTKESGITAPDTTGRLHLWIDFYQPDRRHRDDDNMIASFKAGRDGLALALAVDDRRFVCHPYVKDQIGGMVKIRITAGP